MPTTAPRLLLLDSASLYFRAFFARPDSLRSPQGEPVNAVRGFLDMLARLVAERRPTRLVCCWDDDWRPAWRVDLVPSYKAHRVLGGVDPDTGQPLPQPDPAEPGAGYGPGTGTASDGVEEVPDLLSPQVPVLEAVLATLGIARVGHPGFEADDVIGTLAARADVPTEVVTGDRDLFQVVDDARDVAVLFTISGGMDRWERVTDEVVRAKYGVAASSYADLALLRGDTSDGLPGVRGVGDKKAAALLAAFGSVAAVRAAASEPFPPKPLTPAVTRAVLDAADYLDRAAPVVRVRTDLELAPFDDTLPVTPADPEGFVGLVDRWGLGSSASRILDALASVG